MPRFHHLLPALAALVVAAGCSTPQAVKQTSTGVRQGVATLGSAYESDLADAQHRLAFADKALAHLAAERAYYEGQIERLHQVLADKFVAASLAAYDREIFKFLLEDFEAEFQRRYLGTLQPHLTRLDTAFTEATASVRASPGDADLHKARLLAFGRVAAQQQVAAEDYRILLREAIILALEHRDQLARDVQARINQLTPPTPRKLELPTLATGIEARLGEVRAYVNVLQQASDELDNYIQTSGWRDELIRGFFSGAADQMRARVSDQLTKTGAKLTDYVSTKDADAAKVVEQAFSQLQTLSTQAFDRFKQSASQTLVSHADRISEKLTRTALEAR